MPTRLSLKSRLNLHIFFSITQWRCSNAPPFYVSSTPGLNAGLLCSGTTPQQRLLRPPPTILKGDNQLSPIFSTCIKTF